MAIDGTKIIDSDLGHDIYNEFMDQYDAGVEFVDIRKKVDAWRGDVLGEEEFEIFITVYAQALWEVGELDKETLSEVREAISKRAGYRMWLEEGGLEDAQSRERVLSRFLIKISTPKKANRKRKKYKLPAKHLLEDNDVVSLRMPDGTYRAAIMVKTAIIHRNLVYYFTKTSFEGKELPTDMDIRASFIFMSRIETFYTESYIKKEQPGIEKFWRRNDTAPRNFLLGGSFELVDHRDLIKFCERLQLVTRFNIRDCYKMTGSFGYSSNFEDFSSRFEDLSKEESIWHRDLVPLTEIEDRPNISFASRIISKVKGSH
ncbi:MAG: hypothetical protein ABL952_02335 [Pyrinomonadaceae bacterium]